MKHLTKLLKLMELTRAQVQYGYLLRGIPKGQLSNLAEHHYLVTFTGWQLAISLKEGGANINTEKVIEFCLIHDIGELMGGDISGPYANVNLKARHFAKSFEEENQKYLSKFFGSNSKHIEHITKEILDAKSDEALVAKVADYMECTNYMVYVGNFTEKDRDFNLKKLNQYISKIKDKKAKQLLNSFIKVWIKDITKGNYIDLFS